MSKKTTAPVKTSKTPAAPKPADGPRPTPELLTEMRKAGTLDAALALLQPPRQPKPRADATYAVNATCAEPLPQKRGAGNKVYAVAVLRGERFTVADVQQALPEVRSAAYWVRRLAKTGHLTEVHA